jgi:hypothetical protein
MLVGSVVLVPPVLLNTTEPPLTGPAGLQLLVSDQLRSTPPGLQVKVAAPAGVAKIQAMETVPATANVGRRNARAKYSRMFIEKYLVS